MRDVYLVSALRTPQAKSGMNLKDVPVPFLGTPLLRRIMDEHQLPNDGVDEVIVGNTGAPAKYPNISRVIALEAKLSDKTSAYTVHRNCASGMEALSQAFDKISLGRCDVIFAGGVESMSQMPLIYGKEMTEFFISLMKAKTVSDKMKIVSHFRPNYLSPVIAVEQGLTDPVCGLNMGQTAELLTRVHHITRQEQDEFANNSHFKAVQAQKEGKFDDEIFGVSYGLKLDKFLTSDVGPRAESTVEGLAKMRPYFDKKSGSVTVGNSCPITDGGSMCLLVSEDALKKYNLTPMARIVDYKFAGLGPDRMGMGPLVSTHALLKRTKMTLDQMDLVELNEAFSAQVLAVLKGFKDKKVASDYGIDEVMGELPLEKLNVNGGAVALGHPVGSTGSRLVVTLAHELKRRKAKYGLATLCIGGGQGGAMMIENLS